MVTPARPTPGRKTAEDSLYTFQNLKVLEHLPNSHRSLQYLERIRDDAGVRAVMKKHKWTVGTLQEMEPIGNTDMNSKTLGKNWNRGQVIELRLRTDSYDGWRAYDMVLKTVYHELAHMVHDDHDRHFWDLMSTLQKEGKQMDWRSGGRPLTDQVFYNPPEQDEPRSSNPGLKGGTFKLGGTGPSKPSPAPAAGGGGDAASRREMMARAAEERLKRLAGGAA